MERLGLTILTIVSLGACATSVTSITDQMGDKFPTELSVSADCYVPTFYQDESNISGSGHGLNLQYNYNLCQALIDQFISLAPTVFPATRVLPESLVSFGGQLGGRYSVKTLTGYDKIVPSDSARLLIDSAFVGGIKNLTTKGFCSGNTLETLIFNR